MQLSPYRELCQRHHERSGRQACHGIGWKGWCRPKEGNTFADPVHCICRPCALYLQVLCSVFAGPVHCVCRPYALYWQALCIVFAGPVLCVRRPCIMYCKPCAMHLPTSMKYWRIIIISVRSRHLPAKVNTICLYYRFLSWARGPKDERSESVCVFPAPLAQNTVSCIRNSVTMPGPPSQGPN